MTDNCNKPNALLGHLLTSFNMWNHDYIWNSTPITPTAPTVTWQHLQIVFCFPNSLQRKWMRMEFILLLNIDFRKWLSHFLLYQLSVWTCPFLYGIEHNSSCLLIEVTTFFLHWIGFFVDVLLQRQLSTYAWLYFQSILFIFYILASLQL